MRFLAAGSKPPGAWDKEYYVCGRSCATHYPSNNAPGVSFRFDKPFIESEGRPSVTVETSKGPVYLKFNMDNKYHSAIISEGKYAEDGPEGIEHYSVAEILAGLEGKAQVGIFLLADQTPTYEHWCTMEENKPHWEYYKKYIEQYTKHREKLEKVMEGCLLYESPYFYNTIHSSAKVPYLKLYIYDKEMKHAEV